MALPKQHPDKQSPNLSDTRCADDIRRVAKSLFAERGFDAVSINDIAKNADCSKSNIFHHFGSKQNLYFDVMRDATRRSVAQIREIMGADKQPRARLQHAVNEHYAMIAEDPERSRLMMREVMFSSPLRGRELAEEVFGEQFKTMTDLIRSLGARGGNNPEFMAFVLIAMNVMHFHCRNVVQHFPGTDFASNTDMFSEMVADLLLQNLGVA